MRNFLSIDLNFLKNHFVHDRFIQRFIKKKDQVRIIFLIKSLSFH